ncbi:hypothetical protein ACIO3O_37425 [Streptomyces sp. NPDC087440]|uniref:hypothetical protein n=1 Tax=Streptomyces sp. NPDC087440 TaxID=3365790 RepID=UPI0038039B1B
MTAQTTAPVAYSAEVQTWQDQVQTAVHEIRLLARRHGPGGRIPTLLELRGELPGLSLHVIRAALQTLSREGVLARYGRVTRVLGPDEIHPDDQALVATVRSDIEVGRYRPGYALPTGLLSYVFGHDRAETHRALRHLVQEGRLRRLCAESGPHGPGYYISPSPDLESRQK